MIRSSFPIKISHSGFCMVGVTHRWKTWSDEIAGGNGFYFGSCSTFETIFPCQHGSVRRTGSSVVGFGH